MKKVHVITICVAVFLLSLILAVSCTGNSSVEESLDYLFAFHLEPGGGP